MSTHESTGCVTELVRCTVTVAILGRSLPCRFVAVEWLGLLLPCSSIRTLGEPGWLGAGWGASKLGAAIRKTASNARAYGAVTRPGR